MLLALNAKTVKYSSFKINKWMVLGYNKVLFHSLCFWRDSIELFNEYIQQSGPFFTQKSEMMIVI